MSFGSSGSSKSASVSRPKDVTPPELVELRDPFSQALQGIFGQGGATGTVAGVPDFQATTGQPLVAGLQGSEAGVLQNLLTQIGTRQPYLQNVISGNFLPGGSNENPFLDATIRAAQRPTFQALEETLSRTLPGRFTQAGQFVQPQGSSAFDRAAAIATRGATQEAGDIATRIASQAYEGERGRQQEAIQLSQAEVQTTINNLQAQALPRLIEDLGLERGQQEFQNRLQALLQALAVATGAPLQNIANKTISSSSSGGGFNVGLPVAPR